MSVVAPQRRVWLTVVVLAVVLVSCDPWHPISDVGIKIYSEGDGTAVVSIETEEHQVDADGRAIDQTSLLAAIVEAMDIGQMAGLSAPGPDDYSDGAEVQIVNVNRERIVIRLLPLIAVLEASGYDNQTSVFISICTSALTGTASGVGVELAHMSSCAVWDGRSLAAPTGSIAVLDFEMRAARSERSLIVAFGIALVSLSVALALAFDLVAGKRHVAKVVVVLAMLFATGLTLVSGYEALRFSDTWSSTGQTFDQDLRNGYRAPFFIALFGGILVPLVVLAVGWVFRSKRQGSAVAAGID